MTKEINDHIAPCVNFVILYAHFKNKPSGNITCEKAMYLYVKIIFYGNRYRCAISYCFNLFSGVN